jgi:hypothetical protein
MSQPKKKASRRRVVPRPGYITGRGTSEFFGANDATVLQKIVGHSLKVPEEDVVGRLNRLTGHYFVHYARARSPTPDSKTAEWCEALVGNVRALLDALGTPDAGYPEPQMKLDARTVLTYIGIGRALTDDQYQSMGLGDNASAVLNRVPVALWALKKIAEFAAGEYRRRAGGGRSRQNARQSQNLYLLGAVAHLLGIGYGVVPPRTRPNKNGTYIQAVDFVRRRLIDCIKAGYSITDQATDQKAAKRLQHFTPAAAASLWARESGRILWELERQKIEDTAR